MDETIRVRCRSGPGILREEVWVREDGKLAKYNLAFINHNLCRLDNGRVLGYDNAHGSHERHYRCKVTTFPYTSYEALLERFLNEVRALREE